jgi:general secretion pathway protein L
LQVWEELSRILPDDSWVQELRLAQQGQNGHELTITGFSTAAASLVEVLDRSTLLANVALTAPISLDPIEKRERFVLKARIENAVAKGAP